MEYDNTNTIAIFKNEGAEGKQPGYRGTMNVEGKEYEVALWVRESKAGKKFFSGKIQEPRKKDGQSRQAAAPADDDVPFVNVGRGISGHCYWG